MPIYKGTTKIIKIYKGTTEITNVYKGTQLYYSNGGGGDLPSRYKHAKYICSGNQSPRDIDTISFAFSTETDAFIVNAFIPTTINTTTTLFRCSIAVRFICNSSNDTKIRFGVSDNTISTTRNAFISYKVDKNGVYENGVKTADIVYTIQTFTNTIRFGVSANIKIKEGKIIRNGSELLYHFVAVYDTTSEQWGLYEKKTDTFYTNTGLTGELE